VPILKRKTLPCDIINIIEIVCPSQFKWHLHRQSVVAKMPTAATVALRASASLGDAQRIETVLIIVASPKETMESNVMVTVAGIFAGVFCGQLCHCK
jgi:hypothetical protein